MSRVRLDVRLVELGLAPSRERARALILAGAVFVNRAVVAKAGASIADDAEITLMRPDHPFVGRGGVKLTHALDAFEIDVTGRRALDIGASTGGFTDALLQRGAAAVIAIDVGKGQLDWRLRQDPRVTVIEGVNARRLTRGQLPFTPDLVVVDVSFISLRHILPAVAAVATDGAEVVALVKPQFEAGRAEVGRKGLVRDPAIHERVIQEIARAAAEVGLTRVGTAPSAITGATGNQEYFLYLKKASPSPDQPHLP